MYKLTYRFSVAKDNLRYKTKYTNNKNHITVKNSQTLAHNTPN